MLLKNNSSIPLYEQIIEILLNEISEDKYLPGDKIPTEKELCDYFGVSRITVRKAISELVEQGKLVRQRGKGTFVSYPKIEEASKSGGSFTQSTLSLGNKPETIVKSSKKIQKSLQRNKNIFEVFDNPEQLIVIERIRLSNEIPVIFEVDYFYEHHDFILESDLENTPIMEEVTRKTGLIAKTFEDKIDVVNATERLSEFLDCDLHTPLLRVEQKVLTETEELIYYNIQFIRQDIYKYVVRSEK